MAAKIKKGDTWSCSRAATRVSSGEVVEVRREEGRAIVRGVNSSSGTSASRRRRKAASSPRRRRSTCPTSRSRTRRTASRRASASSSMRRARKCASPSVRALRSMAEKRKEGRRQRDRRSGGGRRTKAEKGEPRSASRKGGKAEAGREGRKAGRRRLRARRSFASAAYEVPLRGGDAQASWPKQFGYKNQMQVPKLEKIVHQHGRRRSVNDRKKVDSAAGDLASSPASGRCQKAAQGDRDLQAARGQAIGSR